MESRQEGLTQTYNRFHNSAESRADIAELRRLHIEMDNAVAATYGWQDFDLGHGFQQTRQGIRFTVSEAARREILVRLLALNYQRHAEQLDESDHHFLRYFLPQPGERARTRHDCRPRNRFCFPLL